MTKSGEARQLSDGDRRAFHELYQEYHHRVYSTCLRMTRNVSEFTTTEFGLSSEPNMRPSNTRILVVEDDADTRELVSYILTRENYEVVLAENPEEAMPIAQSAPFDLFLLDNWMPGASGIQLCCWLRKFDDETPILFFSGAAYEEDKRAALAAGAQGYLTKPADNEKLVEEVSRLISAARRAETAVNLAHVAASGHFGF